MTVIASGLMVVVTPLRICASTVPEGVTEGNRQKRDCEQENQGESCTHFQLLWHS